MTPQVLIDAVVRQTTVLIAQLATSGGVRAPLSHVANQVFLELAGELERQGVSRKVSADMFGLALRGYQRRIQRLTESRTERGRSLWEAVLTYVGSSTVRSRRQIFQRFAGDDEELLRAVLHDLTDSGLLFCSGTEMASAYRAATPDEVGAMRELARDDGLDELAWVIVFRDGPMAREQLEQRLLPSNGDVDAALSRLLATGRLHEVTRDGQKLLESATFFVPFGASEGWAAAVLDHFSAVVTTLCAKLRQSASTSGRGDHTGGSTYTFVVWPGHPLEREVLERLQTFREASSSLRAKVDAYNDQHGVPATYCDVLSYAGQCVLERDREEQSDAPS